MRAAVAPATTSTCSFPLACVSRTVRAPPGTGSVVSSVRAARSTRLGGNSATPCETIVRAKSTGSPPAPRSRRAATRIVSVFRNGDPAGGRSESRTLRSASRLFRRVGQCRAQSPGARVPAARSRFRNAPKASTRAPRLFYSSGPEALFRAASVLAPGCSVAVWGREAEERRALRGGTEAAAALQGISFAAW